MCGVRMCVCVHVRACMCVRVHVFVCVRLTSMFSVSVTKKASPLSPSFICRLTGSPLISMST